MGDVIFGTADYAVFAITLLISASIGVYYRFTGGRQKTAVEYLLADRNMGIIPVAFSLMASFMSAITLLGVSAENYSYGTMFVVINLSYGIFTPVAAYLFLPVFYNLQATSVYEYLERRFGKGARLAGSFAFSLQMILYMGIVLYTPALTLEAVTGMSKVWAILSVGLVCTFYSTIGGLKAVLITDVFQSLLMFAAIYSVIGSAWVEKGSLSEIWRIAEENGRIEFGNFDIDPTVRHTWWSLTFGGGVTFLSLYAVNQAQVQRYLAVKDVKTAQKSLWLNWPILMLLSFSTSFSGIAIYSKYAHCDPRSSCQISSYDQLMPYYVVDTMGHIPGLSGLFVSGIFSASLSTVSAAVNSLAAVTLEDYIKPIYTCFKKKDLPDKGSAYRAKLISVIYGLICIALAFIAEYLGSVLQASLTIFNVVGGPILGLFSLGMFFPLANQTGALTGFLSSLAFSLFLGFPTSRPAIKALPVYMDACLNLNNTCSVTPSPPAVTSDSDIFYLYRLSYMWLGVLGLIVCLVVGIFGSLLASHVLNMHPVNLSNELDPNLFVPPVANSLKKKQQIIHLKSLMDENSVKTTNVELDQIGDNTSISSAHKIDVLPQ
ncbi:putative sodium-dependent multivitamin transporter [Frankliniella occidentalis]|uniref:Sodium-dependent multivitamin transporter n=1 Tax=Frankliniella occidentalis TaxID=133901 RepID=A0A6J1RU89_FRAOC|nr:putative sodium-dependent multivitamin transporter [Frankliniella occidentalis]XP_026272570.1 putative sodium-dependent multivitamin transporter [Frankliniella occidentalis]XP_026272571.1 putative sodium-dependent multivitamin transporter [Frankliniella occidentalis]XP_052126906.1 putative sodium-dependent multivitamin transporter [Frankliniella occidentalis]